MSEKVITLVFKPYIGADTIKAMDGYTGSWLRRDREFSQRLRGETAK